MMIAELRELDLEGLEKRGEELRRELIAIGEGAVRDIQRGDFDKARAKIERLEEISAYFANPPDMEKGISDLWDLYDATLEGAPQERSR